MGAVKQLEAQLFFQLAQLLGEGRLGDEQVLCRQRDVFALVYFQYIPEHIGIHDASPFKLRIDSAFDGRLRQVQHRAKGVKHQSLDAVRDEQPLLLAEQRHHGTVTQQLALTVGQQGTPGAARGGAAGGKLGGVKGVGVARQPAALGGELGQHVVYAAALGADGGQRNGVIALGKPLFKFLRLHFFQREEEGKLFLPLAVDLLGCLSQAAAGGQQEGDIVEIRVGHSLPGRAVEAGSIDRGGGGVACSVAVIDAVYGQPVRDEPRGRCEQPGVRGTGGGAGHLGQRLPQRGRAKHGIAVEEQAPGGIRVGDALQAGGLAGFVQSRGAFFIGNELGCRLAGGTGILHQPQAVDAVPAGFPAEEQAAGGPVIKVKTAAGKGGGGAQAISTPGAVEKVLVAGHGAGQGELGEKILVRLAQAEHKGGITTRLNAEGCLGHLACQHGGAVLNGGKFHRIGRSGIGPEHPPEREHEILGCDGVVGGCALGGGIGQAAF